jgi:hypothetical protein
LKPSSGTYRDVGGIYFLLWSDSMGTSAFYQLPPPHSLKAQDRNNYLYSGIELRQQTVKASGVAELNCSLNTEYRQSYDLGDNDD